MDYVFLKTLIIGSCSLHILHGAFQTGMTKPDWSLGKVLRALHKIFDESPACCDVYLRESDNPLLPFMFDELSLILYRLLRLVFKKEKVEEAANLRQVMKEGFLTEKSNQLEEYLLISVLPQMMLSKRLTLLLKRKGNFARGAKRLLCLYCLNYLNASQPII